MVTIKQRQRLRAGIRNSASWLSENAKETGLLLTGFGLVGGGVIGEVTGIFHVSPEATTSLIGAGVFVMFTKHLMHEAKSQSQNDALVKSLEELSARQEASNRGLHRELATLRTEASVRAITAHRMPQWFPDTKLSWACVRSYLRSYKPRWLQEVTVDSQGRAVVAADRLQSIANVRLSVDNPLLWEIGTYIPDVGTTIHPGIARGITRMIAMVAAMDHMVRKNPELYSTEGIRLWVCKDVESRSISFSLTRFSAKDNRHCAISYNVNPETDRCETLDGAPRRILVDPTPDRIGDLEQTFARLRSVAEGLTVQEFLDRYRDRVSNGVEIFEAGGEFVSYPDGFSTGNPPRREVVVPAKPDERRDDQPDPGFGEARNG